MTIQELNTRKIELLNQVSILVDVKNKKYSNIDMSTPMSIEEKELNNKIASLYSELNIIVKNKRRLS